MKLFVTFGSWGEIAPLLEIALQLQGRGREVAFATTADWAPRVRAYGITCHEFPKAEKHADTLDAFLAAHVIGRSKALYDVIEAAKPSSIVSAFYCWPAFAYAENAGIPCLLTTTSPYYFLNTEKAPAFAECFAEYQTLRKKKEQPEFACVGLYPWYLESEHVQLSIGFPELRPLVKLSPAVAEFIKEPYGVVTRGTLVGRGELDRMVNAIKAHGLKCLYLGPYECKADLSVFLDDHRAAVKGAKVAITHAGIGTTVDCMGSAMVVDPVGYDQFYNAHRLVDLKCAVRVKDSYIKAITEALKPRSFLPNYFDLDYFLRLFDEHTPSEPCRPPADAQQRAQVH
jgi:hypothetical protein